MRHTKHATQILICSLIIAAGPLFGEVNMQVRNGRPIVDGVYVNGHGPYRFLLDTGANVNLIETAIAGKIGMNATFQVDLASVASKTASQGSDGNQVVLDPVKAESQKFLFSPLEAIHDTSPDIQGVLGQWFLSQFDYTLDLRGQHLEFGRQHLDGTRAPFRMLNGRTSISTNLGDLILDSGVARLVRFGVVSNRVDNAAYMRTIAGSQLVGMVFSRLSIQGQDIWSGDVLTMPSRSEPGVDGLMPLSLFKAIYVCNSEGYVVFK